MPYHTGVLQDAPAGPGVVFPPDGGCAGRGGASAGSPAGNIVEREPVGTAEVRSDAAEQLFRKVYPTLAGWARRLVDDDEVAHEIASEAFVRLLSRWTRVDSPTSYLYMVATNLIRDHWRRADRERRALRSVAAGADPVARPDQDVDVRGLIGSLPPRLRHPFLLYYYGGFGVREVAALLGRPEGTIKADLFAARARLKKALGERDG
ncbi:MAG TPA: sigma-70 family RNA polymerase sigma factor [Streptosporangiaceae bacterium]|nr:sigma-70 family RNA polymerase sigma factor [Streptosporangiaceae bacterium]